jgi:CheY-like chemotaxis protein
MAMKKKEIGTPVLRKNCLVLLVDDNVVNQKTIGMRLKRLGFEVHVVSGGQEALEAFSKHTYDLILMDCRMPNMDGFEATRRIREEESTSGKSRVPIIGLCTFGTKDDEDKCTPAGMDDCLVKPVGEREFLEVLESWIRERVAA